MNFIYNYQVNPSTLAVTTQTRFDMASNPDNYPNMNGSAYSSASYGGTSQVYFLNQGNDGLNTSTNIGSGVFSAFSTPAGVGFSVPAGLDMDGSLMLAAIFNTDGGTNKEQLFSVSTSGTFTYIGDISATPASLSIRALAIQPTSFPPALPVTVKIKGPKKVTTTKPTRVIRGTATCTAGITLVEYKIGKAKFRKAKGTTNWSIKAKLKPGVNKIQVKATGANGVVSSVARVTVKVVAPK